MYIFDRIDENPSVDICETGARFGIEHNVDYVIGLGGGSSMDAAKAIALLIKNPKENKDCFYQKKDLSYLDVICIPTTCGTGSEVTSKAVLSIPSRYYKSSISHDIWPKYAFVDAKYLQCAPASLIIQTAIDALCHLVESHLNMKANAASQMISAKGLSMFKDIMSSFQTQNFDYEKLMWISSCAGMAIAQTGTSLPHALSYDLTCRYHIPHGIACGIYLSSFIEVIALKGHPFALEVLDLLGMDIVSFKEWMSLYIHKPKLENKEELFFLICQKQSKWKTACVSFKKEEIQKIIEESVDK
ncbi:iron-containing alcohol dehydrogenase [Floccifex sp.]|uniref:iron-containing alcohol dehydrogenase n=1 Tax=Floccifex sp. TaxID=2815810 RepID=UPI003F099FAD